MSRRIHFEDDAQNPRQPDVAVDDDTKAKRRKQRIFEHEDTLADSQPQTSAAPTEQAGAAHPPADGMPFSENSTGGLNVSGLQHGTANLMRTISPDETPDRNAAVSATRFAFETGATVVAKTAGNKKSKRKSKLKNKDSSLKFGQDEKTADGENQDQAANNTEQPDNDTTPDNMDNEADGDTTPESSQDSDSLNENADTDDIPETGEETDAEPSEQVTTDAEVAGDTDTDGATTPLTEKPNSRLRFTKDEKAAAKLEKRAERLDAKLDKAKDKLPTKTVKKKTLEFDEKKGKAVTKLTHEKEKIPIGEAKWNKPKETSIPIKAASIVPSVAVTKVHAKVHQVEHENVGIKVAHQTELLAESGYRGTKRTAHSAYRFHKNRPYRRVAKLEQKSIKNNIKLDYQKALRDNPKLKSNPLSRFMQKRAIKRNYAKDLRAAKKAAQSTEKAVGVVAKAGKAVTAIIRKNPVFIVKALLFGLIIFLILSLFTMCVGMFSGTSSFIGAVAYPAEFEDINDA